MQRNSVRAFSGANRVKSIVLILLIAALIVFFGGVLADVVRILFGSAVLCFFISPLAKLYGRRLKRPLSALLALLTVAGGLIACLTLLAPLIARQIGTLIETIPNALARLRGAMDALSARIGALLPALELPAADLSGLQGGFGALARGAIHYVGGLSVSLYRFSLMLVLSYFMMAERERVLLRLELVVPLSWRRGVVRMGNALMRELRLYLRGQLTIALAVGALATLGLWAVGVPGALLLGLIVGLLNIIPYLGPWLGGIPAVLMALSLSWQKALLTLALLFVVQQIDGMVISPRVMGNVTGFSPGVVLLALFVGSRVAGAWGMLFAMPALMSIRTVYRVFVQRHENN